MQADKLQQAIYEQLTVSIGGTYPVFDDVPQDQPAPYITIGDDSVDEFDTDTTRGFDAEIVIHCWSEYQGRQEVKQMQTAVYRALHRQTLASGALEFAGVTQEFSETLLDPDGVTRHGVQRFRILYKEI